MQQQLFWWYFMFVEILFCPQWAKQILQTRSHFPRIFQDCDSAQKAEWTILKCAIVQLLCSFKGYYRFLVGNAKMGIISIVSGRTYYRAKILILMLLWVLYLHFHEFCICTFMSSVFALSCVLHWRTFLLFPWIAALSEDKLKLKLTWSNRYLIEKEVFH